MVEYSAFLYVLGGLTEDLSVFLFSFFGGDTETLRFREGLCSLVFLSLLTSLLYSGFSFLTSTIGELLMDRLKLGVRLDLDLLRDREGFSFLTRGDVEWSRSLLLLEFLL